MREKRSALRMKSLNGKTKPRSILLDVLLDAAKRAVLALEEFPQKVKTTRIAGGLHWPYKGLGLA